MSLTTKMLEGYCPSCEQEEKDIKFITSLEKDLGQILTRDNKICHLTSCAFVINKTHDKVLCVFHNLLQTWACPGGHADGVDDMLKVAKTELTEETSLKNFKVLINEPVSVDILPIPSHYRKGEFVNTHLHLNTFYLFEADENEYVCKKEDENSDVKWMTFNEFTTKATELFMKPIYAKIIKKIKALDD